MSIFTAMNHLSVHVNLRKGDLSAQFYVTRDGLTSPVYLYSGGIGYMVRNKSPTVDQLPEALREDVQNLINKYQTYFILKDNK